MAKAEDELILSETSNGVTTISLNRVRQRNALTHDMRMMLIDALTQANADPDSRAIVLAAEGDHFCSGGDISDMTERDLPAGRARMLLANRVVRLLRGSPKPVIAAVEGSAFGAGFSLALACDQIVASESARFCAVFVKVGLVPDYGMLHLLPARAGDGVARRLMLGGEVLSAQDALRDRVVDQVVQPGRAKEQAQASARSYGDLAPLPIAMMKALWSEGRATTLDGALAAEVDLQPALFQSDDFQEVAAAFTAKRKPSFRGR